MSEKKLIEGISSGTYKKCTPFLEAITLGYMAVLTSDIDISIKEDNYPEISYKKFVGRNIITSHSQEQWFGMEPPLFHYPHIYKWQQEVYLKTPKGYSTLFTHPLNRLDLPFTTISGVVETDLYNIPTHFPFWLKYGFEGIVKKGTPICQIIPFKRDNYKIKNGEYSEKDSIVNMSKFQSIIDRAYKNMFWVKKRYE